MGEMVGAARGSASCLPCGRARPCPSAALRKDHTDSLRNQRLPEGAAHSHGVAHQRTPRDSGQAEGMSRHFRATKAAKDRPRLATWDMVSAEVRRGDSWLAFHR